MGRRTERLKMESSAQVPIVVESGLAEVNGARLYYEVVGTGAPLVLVHGFGLDRRMWDEQFRSFARRRRVVRYDLRGIGRSAPPEPGQPYRHADDLKRLLDYFEIDQAALVGLSLGGLVGLYAALEQANRMSALVLVDAIVSGWPMSAEWDEEYGQVRREARARGVETNKQGWLNIGTVQPTREHPRAGLCCGR
jgi:pimeloyl-ACP methyl ester carboxylesterase